MKDTVARTEALRFEDDRGASRSQWIAGALVLALVGWMGSGLVLPSAEVEVEEAAEARAVTVAVRESRAEAITRSLRAEGQAIPERETAVPAETSGEVAEVVVEKGATVEAGAVLARLDAERLRAALDLAEANEVRARREFDNAEALLDRGVATVDRLAEARSALAAAEAEVVGAREDLEAAEVTAPFAGRVEALDVDPGEFVAEGAEVARIVDVAPLTIEIRLPQQSMRRVREGMPAEVRFITGEERTGRVVFVGRAADAETRTFLAEVEVENADGAIPAGVSAEVIVPTEEVSAHFLSPAILSLDTGGALGVKTVGEDGRVAFHEVEIVRAQTDGVWVAGLPEAARIVTIGQGFVSDGEAVDARPEDALTAGAEGTDG